MCLLLESICYTPEGFQNLHYHAARMQHSAMALFGKNESYELAQRLHASAPPCTGTIKCRVLYNRVIQEIQYIPYQPQNPRTFQLVQADELMYAHKFADREQLNTLKAVSTADEIIIVQHGFITDASYANLVFFDGHQWITPAKPLLPGTQRARLLTEGVIVPADIHTDALKNFSAFMLINAMLPFASESAFSINQIQF